MADFDITQSHNDDRLSGSLAFFNRGTGNSTIEIYEGTKGNTGASTLLAVCKMSKPAGSVTGHQLVLTATEFTMVLVTGTPQWARWKNGEGTAGGDSTASDLAGAGIVKVETHTDGKIYAGSALAIVSAALT